MTRPLPQAAQDLAAWLAEQPGVNAPLLAAVIALRPSTHGHSSRTGTYRTTTLTDPRPGLLALMAAPLADRDGYRPEWAEWVPAPVAPREIPPRPNRPHRP